MLSYRHAFHAGNHADVLKHTIQLALLDYLKQKDKPFWIVDTHAGAGGYVLNSDFALKTAEWWDGIARLWSRDDLPPLLANYVDLVKNLHGDDELRYYPGSPWFSLQAARDSEHLRLFELHPTDFPLLAQNICDPRVRSEQKDGFAGLKAVLPPPPRRALVLIDPPYEDKKDYQRVVNSLQDALKRFANGVYAVWYPCLQRFDARDLPEQLKQLPVKSWLRAELHVQSPASDGFGMHGSGMFILNPPWTLAQQLADILPYLVQHLGQDSGARFVLEQQSA
ncbi:23S rRNA (adenine(2030)-N(6))-methyltransferase RlmJ [Aquaspirillum serpens]|uniref:23S rRNA (adenine(2030)-N(6))-methyltransferase RlmJ n=1 Tax=Aquaspirillum serpens TaxID=190 RepID=UPI0003B32708|nr:23S rRNA (adenine(2030)-N(6))-methyltransferase RlmJ [Aquaspirillum serpens]